MIFEIEKKKLMESLTFVQKAITGNATIPILNGVFIEAKDQKITFKGSDTITTITTICDANITEEGSVVVDSQLLLGMKKFPDGIINFNISDDKIMNVKANKTKAKLPILSLGNEYPKIEELKNENNSFVLKSSDLKDMLKKVLYAVAKDETRPILTGVLFHCKDNDFNMVSLDGYRLSNQKRKLKNVEDFELVIPSKSLLELSKIIDNEEEITISSDNNNVLFKFNNVVLQTRLLEGKFIKYDSLIPTDNDIKIEVDSETLKETINRCLIVNKDNSLIKLNLTKENLIISSNTALGEIEEELDYKSNKDLEIAFNGLYLLDVCNNYKGILEFSFKTSVSPCVVKDKEGIGVNLVLPVRLMKR